MPHKRRFNSQAGTAAVVHKESPRYWATQFRQSLSSVGKKEQLKSHELTFILRSLSTLVSNGVSLPKAIGTLAREDNLAKHHDLLESLRRKVASGVSFSVALSQFDCFNDPLLISQIRVGERSGTLATSLQKLSENRSKSAELHRTIVRKIAYPTLLVIVGSGLLTFLLMYVVPVFQETYQKAGVPLPFITQALIDCSQAMKSYGWMLAAGVILTVSGVQQLRKHSDVAITIDRALLRLPLCGNWLRDIAVLQLMEVLQNLMEAGYTVAEAVKETADSVGNRAVRKSVCELQLAIQRGERFSRELERHEDMFPPIVNQLVIVGESTGQLTKATEDICEYLRSEIERKTSLIVGSLEPILTISLASAIAVVLLAIYLPMFDMVNTLGQ